MRKPWSNCAYFIPRDYIARHVNGTYRVLCSQQPYYLALYIDMLGTEGVREGRRTILCTQILLSCVSLLSFSLAAPHLVSSNLNSMEK